MNEHQKRHWPPKLVNVEWRKRRNQRVAHAYRLYRGRPIGPLCDDNNTSKHEKNPGELVSFGKCCSYCKRNIGRIQDQERVQVAEHFADLEFRGGL
jgi:hypothetical protein